MKLAVIYFHKKNAIIRRFEEYFSDSEKYGKNVADSSFSVKFIDGIHEKDVKLGSFDYFIIGTRPEKFFSKKIPVRVTELLAQTGSLLGKKAVAYIIKNGIFSDNSLVLLMSVLESQGMLVKNFFTLTGKQDADDMLRKLNITK